MVRSTIDVVLDFGHISQFVWTYGICLADPKCDCRYGYDSVSDLGCATADVTSIYINCWVGGGNLWLIAEFFADWFGHHQR